MNVLKRAESFASQWLEKLEPWLSGTTPLHTTTTHRICLHLSSNKLSLLHINKEAGNTDILLNEQLEFDTIDNLTTVLAGLVKRYHLENTPSYWLLSPDDYQLFYIDALPVKGNEFKDALNWRLRSLVTFPIQEAATDYFLLPTKKSAATQPMVVAVVSRKSPLQKNVDISNKVGLTLSAIDIPELAMRNLTSTCEDDEKSTAFLYFYKNIAILNITRQKILYFTRRINIPPDSETAPHFYDNLSLELLRYFDYFQSQSRYPSPSRFYLASYNGKTDHIIAGLSTHLTIQLEPFPLSRLIIDASKTTRLENNLLLLGAALREEETNVTPER